MEALDGDCLIHIYNSLTDGDPSVPMLMCIARGVASTCKNAWVAYHEWTTPLDGVAIQTIKRNPKAWSVGRGKTVKEIAAENETIDNPYYVRIVRDTVKPGRPVVVLFVYGKTGPLQLHECASQISAINFVSFFSTKDAHNSMWRAFYHLEILPEEELDVSKSQLPLVNTTPLLWPHIYPATWHHRIDEDAYIPFRSGDVAVRVPRDVDAICQHDPIWGRGRTDEEYLSAVFGDRLLAIAGKHDTHTTLNGVPFVLAVDTPVDGFSNAGNGAHQRRRVQLVLDGEKAREAQFRGAPTKQKRKSFGDASCRIKQMSLLLNETMSNGALPICMKPHETEYAETTGNVIDARYATFGQQTDTDSDDSE